MKLSAALVIGLVGMATCTEAAAPMFRARYAGSKKPLCLNADASGPSLKSCDDTSAGQQWMLNADGNNVVGVSSMATMAMGESKVTMNRTPVNSYTIEFDGKCYGKAAKLVNCPNLKVSGKGKAAKKANTAIKRASFYIEPIFSIAGMDDCGDSHDGHDHGASDGHDHGASDGHDHSTPTMPTMSYMPASAYMPAGHSADDGHDHSMPTGHSAHDGHDHSATETISSSFSWMPAGHSADDGHDHSMPTGHSAHDGHDHSGGGMAPAPRPSLSNCQILNGRVVCGGR